MKDRRETLRQIYKTWVHEQVIVIENGQIAGGNFDTRTRSLIAPYRKILAEHLYSQLVDAKISYDAVVGIPTSGNAWARALADIATERDARTVPVCKLQKVGEKRFSFPERRWSVPPQARLLVVDDTLGRGDSSYAVVGLLRRSKYLIAGLATPVELTTVGRDRWRLLNRPVVSVFNNEFALSMSKP